MTIGSTDAHSRPFVAPRAPSRLAVVIEDQREGVSLATLFRDEQDEQAIYHRALEATGRAPSSE